MPTTVYLVRAGETTWSAQGRINGRRDIGLTEEGQRQGQRTLSHLESLQPNEILSSPLSRAVQTAEIFAAHFNLGIGRDPRLMELDLGSWEGGRWEEIERTESYQRLLDEDSGAIPGGEDLRQASQRAITSVEQAVADNPQRSSILITSHAFILGLILASYLGAPLARFLGLQMAHGAISILRFFPGQQNPHVLGINLGVPLAGLVAGDQEGLVAHLPAG